MRDAASPDPDEILLAPVLETGRAFYLTVALLVSVILWAAYAYALQLRDGLAVTGLNRPVYWGVYIVNFVFFIGISHAGTLISAILRLCKAEWRRSITRAAETITVLVLVFGVINIILDMGRPDRLPLVITSAHFSSPLLWDVIAVGVYLMASTIYLYLPLIPDIALLRDRVTGWRRPLYRALAIGWQGTEGQRRVLERGIAVMAIAVIPIAVSVHTVVAWVFSMTVQPLWRSTIFGPYFVMGAIYSGIAALILAMGVIRRVYGLGGYLKPVHFRHLGTLLLVMNLLWFYFVLAEHVSVFYWKDPQEMRIFAEHLMGRYAPVFWVLVGTMAAVLLILVIERLPVFRRPAIWPSVAAATLVILGMWLERFVIVVPTLVNPRLPSLRGAYGPTWIEWALLAGSVAAFLLLYVLFTKLFPIVSIWEVKEGRSRAVPETAERIRTYLPAPSAQQAAPEGEPT
jgi:molybdopterin-containing oxidoreductase family membrane subunit